MKCAVCKNKIDVDEAYVKVSDWGFDFFGMKPTTVAHKGCLELKHIFSQDEVHVIWAAMLAMTHDIHAAQDQLTEEQWKIAEKVYHRFLGAVDARDKS